MTDADIAIRKPVWIAMSDLFLDTDVRIWYPYGARTLAASPFTHDELDAIFRTEVRPVVGSNLMQIAGEWAGFDTDWLVSAVLKRVGKSEPWLSFNAAERDWQSLQLLVASLRKLAPEARPQRVEVWEKLSKLFLDRSPVIAAPAAGWPPREELARIWDEEMWPAYSHSIKAYYKWSAQNCPSEDEVRGAGERLKLYGAA